MQDRMKMEAILKEDKAVAERHKEASSKLARLIKQYDSREHVTQLVAEGCDLIGSYALTDSEMRRCRKIDELMRRVLAFNEPLGTFYNKVDRGINNLIKWFLLAESQIGDMYSELYQKVCDCAFSGYVARAEGEIELTPKFEERMENEAAKKNSEYCWNVPFLRAPSVDFGAEKKYGKHKKNKERR